MRSQRRSCILPDHNHHCNIDRLLLGAPYLDVHKVLDLTAAIEGPNHRSLFHDDEAIEDMLIGSGDNDKAWAAFYHIVLDMVSDRVGPDAAVSEMIRMYLQDEIPAYMAPRAILLPCRLLAVGEIDVYGMLDIPPKLREKY